MSESTRDEIDMKAVSEPTPGSERNNEQICKVNQKAGKSVGQCQPLAEVDSTGDVNMEATILPDDVIRAGGFGARDDISSFLPVASDSTDLEASIRGAQDYEQPQEEVHRPGLGWTEAPKTV